MTGAPVELWWFDVRAQVPAPAELSVLSPDEQERAAAYAFDADRHRYQVAHVALRQVLSARAGLPPAELSFGRDPCPVCGRHGAGRPTLPGSGVHFSLAHSGDLVAIAVAAVPVGVDVEAPPRGCSCPLAADMHPEDRARVVPLAEADRHAATMRWWARLEALLKCRGEGIGHGVHGFAVLAGAQAASIGGCGITSVPAPPDYQAAVASLAARPQVMVGRGGRAA